MANAKDAERCNSGVLDMRALDGLECYEGTFTDPYVRGAFSLLINPRSPRERSMPIVVGSRKRLSFQDSWFRAYTPAEPK